MRRDTLTLHTALGSHRIEIEIAETEGEKAHGLMFRRSLGDHEGMFFPYARAHEITMWMRNTLIPLDMIFVRPNGIVHRIVPDAEPLSERIIASEGDVTAVIEMKAGLARRLGLQAGDRIEHAHFADGALGLRGEGMSDTAGAHRGAT